MRFLDHIGHLHVGMALGFALLFAGPLGAEEAKGAEKKEAPAAAIKKEKKLTTVVVGLRARRGVDADLAMAMSSVVQGVLMEDPKRSVMGFEEIRSLLNYSGEKQALGCGDEGCLAEIASALDADRLITGSMDKVGSSFLVVITELDAHQLSAVGRAQATISQEEDQLVQGVTELTQKLMQTLSTEATQVETPFAASGNLSVTTVPSGARVFSGNQALGTTPMEVGNLKSGELVIRLVRDDYESVEVKVPIAAGKKTEVHAELHLSRTIAEANQRELVARHDEATLWTTSVSAGKMVCGSLSGLVGGLALLNQAGAAEQRLGTCLVCGLLGGGLGAWGYMEWKSIPSAPLPDWALERQVRITPAEEEGEPQVLFTRSLTIETSPEGPKAE